MPPVFFSDLLPGYGPVLFRSACLGTPTMKFGWLEALLLVIAAAVLTLVTVWAWEEFKTWRLNREYGPDHRRGAGAGRRRND